MYFFRVTIEYILRSQIGQIFWKWVQNVEFPEEIFFNTLVRINKIKPIRVTQDGAYLVNQRKYNFEMFIYSEYNQVIYNISKPVLKSKVVG